MSPLNGVSEGGILVLLRHGMVERYPEASWRFRAEDGVLHLTNLAERRYSRSIPWSEIEDLRYLHGA